MATDRRQKFQGASGQPINLDKSKISFSQNVATNRRHEFQGWMDIKAVTVQSRYLGLPSSVGRPKQQIFECVQDKVWKKLKGWKDKFLSTAGKKFLLKEVFKQSLLMLWDVSCRQQACVTILRA